MQCFHRRQIRKSPRQLHRGAGSDERFQPHTGNRRRRGHQDADHAASALATNGTYTSRTFSMPPRKNRKRRTSRPESSASLEVVERAQQHVTLAQRSAGRRASGLDLQNLQAEPHWPQHHAQRRPRSPAHELHRVITRNCDSQSVHDGGIDPHHLSARVGQWTTGIARRQPHIGANPFLLPHPLEWAGGMDHAGGNSARKSQRTSHCNHQLARPQSARIAGLSRGKFGARGRHAQGRQVPARISRRDTSVQLAAVPQLHLRLPLARHVGIGENQAVTFPDDARPSGAGALGEYLHGRAPEALRHFPEIQHLNSSGAAPRLQLRSCASFHRAGIPPPHSAPPHAPPARPGCRRYRPPQSHPKRSGCRR